MGAAPAWMALGAAVAGTAFGQVAYKLHFRRRGPLALPVAAVLFVGASACAYLALRTLPLGTVYMSTALTQLLVAALARPVLGERLTRDHAVALALIVSGVVLYTR